MDNNQNRSTHNLFPSTTFVKCPGTYAQKEWAWFGVVELDEEVNAETGPGLDGSLDLLPRDACVDSGFRL